MHRPSGRIGLQYVCPSREAVSLGSPVSLQDVTFVLEPVDEPVDWNPDLSLDEEQSSDAPAVPGGETFAPPLQPQRVLDEVELPPVDSTGIVSTPSMPDERQLATSSVISPSIQNCVASPLASSSWTGPGSPWSAFSPRPISSPSLSPREAFLLRSFIHKIAPWADICDMQSHFTTEVPRRALQVPMVLKAVLSLSARHDAIMSHATDVEASEYHGQCLELLIAALAKPEESYDDNLLITVVILRIYEELENSTDEQYHLFGSNRLLNTMSKSAYSGGLAEAVSWQFLRQAIYASVVQYQPLVLDLENYERSAVFLRTDDASYSNIIIFLCARIIQLCTGPDSLASDEGAWKHLAQSVERWHRARPITWQPLRYRSADGSENRPFPELWMMSPPAVVGLQYYHAACIFLTTSDGHWRGLKDYELARSRRLAEKTIASHVAMVIGLSSSNEAVENANFMACHLLHRFGHCLRNPAEQRGSLKFLQQVEKKLGWRTAWMAQELEREWAELQELDSWDI
ncbi:hypothetical protein MW887_006241 [Aspergillus wentii]|nr:hypothetical protein MW887_006241 [Aspergillus wentii]